jgi:hypothetical protein
MSQTPRQESTEETIVRANETAPGKVVFSEDDNSDAWIATDLTVDVPR